MQIKITDVSTGSVILSTDVKGEPKLLGFIAKYHNSPSKAAFAALNEAEKEVKKKLRKAFPAEGKIVEILKKKKKKEKFLVSVGSSLGVKKGSKLLVLERTMIELDGQMFPREKEIGQLEVTKIEADGFFSQAKAKKKGQAIVKKFEEGVELIVRTKGSK